MSRAMELCETGKVPKQRRRPITVSSRWRVSGALRAPMMAGDAVSMDKLG